MIHKVIMVQGTASTVGKSVLVAALCRMFQEDGLLVAPFKAQNMSLNSDVTPDGGEIGRAQAMQAAAAGIESAVEMNPVLLKPESDSRSQVVLLGRPYLSVPAGEYHKLRNELWPVITRSLDTLRANYDVVVIEGAGSPAEINLRSNDIVNMRVARYSKAPVLLVGDIDRGGIFASLLGTLWLLEPEELELVRGLVINKFRGDCSLLEPGLGLLESKAKVPVLGVIPYFNDIRLPEEDSVMLEWHQPKRQDTEINIAVVRLPHISNFDDFDPLAEPEHVNLYYVDTPEQMDDADLVILPGSKTTVSDLDWMLSRGLGSKILELHERGAFIIGICGGYQMLGQYIFDPQGVESSSSTTVGLALLPVNTVFSSGKETHRVRGVVQAKNGLLKEVWGISFQGYEIHMAMTKSPSDFMAFGIEERSGQRCIPPAVDGCISVDGRVLGTYIHGLFHNRELCFGILKSIVEAKGNTPSLYTRSVDTESEFKKLATLVRRSLDIDLLYHILESSSCET
ncbi:cobyric acid synthase [Chloroflexota bacterium]